MEYTRVEGDIRKNLNISTLNPAVQKEFRTFISMLGGLKEGEYFEYFNNFILYLPLSKFPEPRIAFDLSEEELFKGYDEKRGKQLIANLEMKYWDSSNSELLQAQTLREFYQTIDDTFKECNLFDGYKELKRNKVAKNKLELSASPVFFKLLDKGYKKYPDLIG